MTEEQIRDINWVCSSLGYDDQGIFKEPYSIRSSVKGHVVYWRFNTGGMRGGSCWDTGEDDGAQPYENDEDPPTWVALLLTVGVLCPHIKYEQFVGIQGFIRETSDSDYEYYGNCENYDIKYIELDKLEKYLNCI